MYLCTIFIYKPQKTRWGKRALNANETRVKWFYFLKKSHYLTVWYGRACIPNLHHTVFQNYLLLKFLKSKGQLEIFRLFSISAQFTHIFPASHLVVSLYRKFLFPIFEIVIPKIFSASWCVKKCIIFFIITVRLLKTYNLVLCILRSFTLIYNTSNLTTVKPKWPQTWLVISYIAKLLPDL